MYEIKSFGKASFKSLPKFLLPVLSRDPLLPSLRKEKARSTHGFAAILWVKRKMALEGPSCYIDVTGGLDRWCCTSKTFSPSQSGGCGWLWMIEDESSNGRMGTKKTMILQRHTFFYLFFLPEFTACLQLQLHVPILPLPQIVRNSVIQREWSFWLCAFHIRVRLLFETNYLGSQMAFSV